ncbi:MAG: FliA/WhiG family RNA polymerase sigma factor [Clostridia bacterium]|nr:FliA/WhiG family RNA polymerase sigma factor [Clostridia bacterium]
MTFNREEEAGLWSAYRDDRNVENRNKLVVFYSPFIKITLGRLVSYYNKYIDYEDLMAYGMLSLIDAIEKFDAGKGVKFETYASIRIRGGIIDQLRKQDWLPTSLRQKIKKVEAAYNEIESQFGRTATEEEVAEYMGISVPELKNLLETSHTANVICFDELISNSFASGEYDPEYSLEEKFIRDSLVKAVDTLSEKEKMVISLYYYDELTLKEIGAVLGVSESRVSQIHSKVLLKLKSKLSIMIKTV